jgi:hypothetical protein
MGQKFDIAPEIRSVLRNADAHGLVEDITCPGLSRQKGAYLGINRETATYESVAQDYGIAVADAWDALKRAHDHFYAVFMGDRK